MKSVNLSDCEAVDCELLQRLSVHLRQQGFAPYRTLALCVENGVVELQGRLPTFHLRQVAVECVKRVAGVTRVVDRISVDPTS
jgi:osmotically-inducible protein OsmY